MHMAYLAYSLMLVGLVLAPWHCLHVVIVCLPTAGTYEVPATIVVARDRGTKNVGAGLPSKATGVLLVAFDM